MKTQLINTNITKTPLNQTQDVSALQQYSIDKKERVPWSKQQNRRYLNFLLKNSVILGKKNKKQKFRLFNKMVATVETRTSRQCKSHHQKFIKKYKTIQKVVQKLSKQIYGQKKHFSILKEQTFSYENNRQLQNSVLDPELNKKINPNPQKQKNKILEKHNNNKNQAQIPNSSKQKSKCSDSQSWQSWIMDQNSQQNSYINNSEEVI